MLVLSIVPAQFQTMVGKVPKLMDIKLRIHKS